MPEERIRDYIIEELIGAGGMGMVYLARHETLQRPAAIKVLLENLTANSQLRERFVQEAKLMASLSHQKIVTLYEFTTDPQLCLIMEYIEGKGLDRMIGQEIGPIPWERALPLFTQVLSGVGYAHSRGVVHRDIKPANILVSETGLVKITDFGIAKIAGQKGMTRTGIQMGTLYYESPEQIRGASDIDHRADIYSLGMTLYEMLAGRLPFDTEGGTSEFDITQQIVFEENPTPDTFYPHIPEWLVVAVKKATMKDPNRRFQSCEEFLEYIEKRGDGNQDDKLEITEVPLKTEKNGSHSAEFSSTKGDSKHGYRTWVFGFMAVAIVIFVLLISGVFTSKNIADSTQSNPAIVPFDTDEPETVSEESSPEESVAIFDPVNTIRPDVISSLAASCRNRLVTFRELDNLSYRELKLLRNYFFAYYNRPFAVQWIRDYFIEYMPSYRGDGSNDPELSSIERDNVNRVIQYEQDNNVPVIDY